MPRFRARRPVRRGVECAFRSSAAVVVEFSAGMSWRCAKRSRLGPNVDLMPRALVWESVGVVALCWASRRCERVAEGSRGSEPQLRGVRGGIVWCGATSAGVCCGSRSSKSGYFLALEKDARDARRVAGETIPISPRWARPNRQNQLLSQYEWPCELFCVS